MMMEKENMMFMAGIAALILGICLILAWWPSVVAFFKGFLGIALAIGGLVMMYMKKS